jgi:hypothetical protein
VADNSGRQSYGSQLEARLLIRSLEVYPLLKVLLTLFMRIQFGIAVATIFNADMKDCVHIMEGFIMSRK